MHYDKDRTRERLIEALRRDADQTTNGPAATLWREAAALLEAGAPMPTETLPRRVTPSTEKQMPTDIEKLGIEISDEDARALKDRMSKAVIGQIVKALRQRALRVGLGTSIATRWRDAADVIETFTDVVKALAVEEPIASPREANTRIIRALGLEDVRFIGSLTVRLSHDDFPTVTLEKAMSEPTVAGLEEELTERFRLVPKE